MGFRDQNMRRLVSVVAQAADVSAPEIPRSVKPVRKEGERYAAFQLRLDNWCYRQTVACANRYKTRLAEYLKTV